MRPRIYQSVHLPGWINPLLLLVLCALGFTGYYMVRYIKRKMRDSNEKNLMTGIFLYGTQGIILTQEAGQIVMVNPFAERLFGFEPKTLIGHDINKLLHQNPIIESPTWVQIPEFSKRLTAIRKDGSEFTVELSSNRYQSNGRTYTVHFIIDITQRIINEEKIEMQKRELEIVNQQLESFSYSVSHDLRAPLRAVGGYAQMLTEDYSASLDQEANRLLANIQTNASRMGSLIDDLLTFSRLGRKEVHKSTIDMNQVAKAALLEISESFDHHAEVTIDPLPSVMADKSLMGHVMSNLLSNAIKYSSKREKPIVQISYVAQGDYLVFCVRDNGVGFDMKYLNKLFGVFQRLHLDSEFEGTGVGLAIAHRIVQKHGGMMSAESKDGAGATFYFSLPIEKVDGHREIQQTTKYEEFNR